MTNPLQNERTASVTPIKQYESIEDFDTEFDPLSGWLLLLYGMFGSGKTFFCGTAIDSLYINTGFGEDTLRSPLFLSKYSHVKRKIKNIVHRPDKLAFDQVCDVAQTVIDSDELSNSIKTIILDDTTALRSMAMSHWLKGSGKDINKFTDTDMRDVGKEMSRINWFFEHHLPIFKSMGINFILTAHESRIYGKASKMGEERPLKEIRPGFSGEKFPDAVPSKFDEVWYIELKNNNRTGNFSQIKTGGGGIEITRTRRAGVFPNYIINQDFETLLQIRKENKLHKSYS